MIVERKERKNKIEEIEDRAWKPNKQVTISIVPGRKKEE